MSMFSDHRPAYFANLYRSRMSGEPDYSPMMGVDEFSATNEMIALLQTRFENTKRSDEKPTLAVLSLIERGQETPISAFRYELDGKVRKVPLDSVGSGLKPISRR